MHFSVQQTIIKQARSERNSESACFQKQTLSGNRSKTITPSDVFGSPNNLFSCNFVTEAKKALFLRAEWKRDHTVSKVLISDGEKSSKKLIFKK